MAGKRFVNRLTLLIVFSAVYMGCFQTSVTLCRDLPDLFKVPTGTDIVNLAALVTCEDGVVYNPFSDQALTLVPQGGRHLLFIHTNSNLRLPPMLNERGVEAFAGTCPVESGCLVETGENGKPIQENRIPVTIARIDEHTLGVEYILPENEPKQVQIELNVCEIWESDDFCFDPDELGGNVGAYASYVFRYETLEHIDEQPPDAICGC